MEDLLPQLALKIDRPIADPVGLFVKAPTRIWVEIGFGGGEHLAGQALSNPDTGFLGCEPFENGAAKLLAIIAKAQLNNIRLHVGDAGELIDRLPSASVDRVYLLYPDPWPKRRQRKRRFISDGILKRLARVLIPGGELRFATDIDDYAGWALARVMRSAELSWHPASSADWRLPWAGWTGTRYEAKAIAAGRPSSYFTFVRK